MNVADVLKQKQNNAVEAVQASDPLRAAAERFQRIKVRGLVVTDAGVPVGVVTLRDLVTALLVPGASLDDAVSTAMSKKLASVTPETALDDVQATMADLQINHVPVVKDGKLVGILTLADLLRTHLDFTEMSHAALRRYIAGPYSL